MVRRLPEGRHHVADMAHMRGEQAVFLLLILVEQRCLYRRHGERSTGEPADRDAGAPLLEADEAAAGNGAAHKTEVLVVAGGR